MIKKVVAIGVATVTAGVTGAVVLAGSATASDAHFRSELRDPRGRTVGTVHFRIARDKLHVDARLRPNRYVTKNQFHGFHVHANNLPAEGTGCIANPNNARSTWFLSADGHLSATGQSHGKHNGDMPSPLVLSDGTARLRFTTDRIEPAVLRGTAVILHDKPDNFGNVPPDQYSPRTPGALDLTARTGNAGDRVACGLVRRSWW